MDFLEIQDKEVQTDPMQFSESLIVESTVHKLLAKDKVDSHVVANDNDDRLLSVLGDRYDEAVKKIKNSDLIGSDKIYLQ